MDFYINSKGRADTISTSKLLDACGIRHKIVVEPQDVSEYKQTLLNTGSLLVLPENNKGLPYAREFTLQNAIANYDKGGTQHICILDDDVKAFGRVVNERCKKGDANDLLWAGEVFVEKDIAQMALQYQQFAWSAKKAFTYPTHCDCVVFFNLKKVRNIHYDTQFKMKGDWDYSLQVLKNRMIAATFNKVYMAVPTMGTNKGGLSEGYADNKDWEMARRLSMKWGSDIVSLKWKNRAGRKVIDCKVDWKHFLKGAKR